MTDMFNVPPVPVTMQVGTENPIIESPIVPDFGVGLDQQENIENNELSNNIFGPSKIQIEPASQPVSQQVKYQIFDIFWLFYPGLFVQPPKLTIGQAHAAIISFNIAFGNLRVSLYNITQDTFKNNVAFLSNMQRLVSGTIYPSSAFSIYNSPRISTICIEQLIQSTGADWQQNRPICRVDKAETKIRITIDDSRNGKYFYDFEGWQRDAFLYACQFAYTKGLYLHALNTKY